MKLESRIAKYLDGDREKAKKILEMVAEEDFKYKLFYEKLRVNLFVLNSLIAQCDKHIEETLKSLDT